jgi:hypothetical protein
LAPTPAPFAESRKIAGLVAFYNEKVDIYVDGRLALSVPATRVDTFRPPPAGVLVRRDRAGARGHAPRGEEDERPHLVGMMQTLLRPVVIGPTCAPWGPHQPPEEVHVRGTGRVAFAATMLLIVGVVNIIYGIGALDGANIFVNDQRYILTDLNTLGWVVIVLGVIQLVGGLSLMAGNTFGRAIGIIGGVLGAIGALLSIGGNNPWWSLAIFFLCVYIVHGIFVFGEDERAVRT